MPSPDPLHHPRIHNPTPSPPIPQPPNLTTTTRISLSHNNRTPRKFTLPQERKIPPESDLLRGAEAEKRRAEEQPGGAAAKTPPTLASGTPQHFNTSPSGILRPRAYFALGHTSPSGITSPHEHTSPSGITSPHRIHNDSHDRNTNVIISNYEPQMPKFQTKLA